jgi:hypothetical protein
MGLSNGRLLPMAIRKAHNATEQGADGALAELHLSPIVADRVCLEIGNAASDVARCTAVRIDRIKRIVGAYDNAQRALRKLVDVLDHNDKHTAHEVY